MFRNITGKQSIEDQKASSTSDETNRNDETPSTTTTPEQPNQRLSTGTALDRLLTDLMKGKPSTTSSVELERINVYEDSESYNSYTDSDSAINSNGGLHLPERRSSVDPTTPLVGGMCAHHSTNSISLIFACR